jgi:tetratricopeptide (TPR) repeat protein
VATDLAISPIAHDAYLRGRIEFTRFTEGALRRSLVWYERALGIAPDYALAHAGLADAYIQLGQSRAGFMAPREAMPRARAAATRALELDASLSDAHAALAECLMWYDWKWTEAEDAFRAAIDLNPSNSRARLWYALLLSYRQRGGEAIAEIERARELDPFSPLVNTYVGVVEYLGGDVERAVAALDRTLADDPTYHWAHYFRGVVLRHAGRYQDAIAAFEEAIRLAPDAASPLAHLGHTLCLSGRPRGRGSFSTTWRVWHRRSGCVPRCSRSFTSVSANWTSRSSAFAARSRIVRAPWCCSPSNRPIGSCMRIQPFLRSPPPSAFHNRR